MDITKKEINCPACGSININSRHEIRLIPVPFAPTIEHDEVVNLCCDCGMEGDFLRENRVRLPAIIEAAKKESAKRIINDLVEDEKLSMSYMERAFDLPMRTMTRWKSGDISAAGVSLLRLIRTYPWLVEIADSQYDKSFATHRLAGECVNAMKELAEMCNLDAQFTVSQNENISRKRLDAIFSFSPKDEFIVHQKTSPNCIELTPTLGASV